MVSPPAVAQLTPSLRPTDFVSNIMFFSAAVLDSDQPNLAELILESVKGVFVETDDFFRFRINPSNMKVAYTKAQARTFTKNGFEWSHFGNNLTTLSYSGTTGYFRPPNIIENAALLASRSTALGIRDEIAARILSGEIDIRISPVWQKFRRFEKFYQRLDGQIVMYFDTRLYRGVMGNFNYAEDANNPLQILYSFNVEAQTDSRIGEDRLGGELINLGG